jgi:hypothetical protein
MVKLRGGLEKLGYNGLLKNWYTWCNSMYMMESSSGNIKLKGVPRFPEAVLI